MSLTPCKKCGFESFGNICPNCQNKKSSSSLIYFIVFFLLACFALPFILSDTDTTPSKNHKETRKDKIEKHFSSWDGSHVELTKIIKSTMNDPDSYKHVETKYGDQGEYISVKTTFRGKNAFGGVVTNWITAKCSIDGKVLEITGQGP